MITSFILSQLIFVNPKYTPPKPKAVVVVVEPPPAPKPPEPVPEPPKPVEPPVEAPKPPPVDYTNLYAWGNCTHYVKAQKPSLPNDLHNARDWLVNAQADGLETGYNPRVGAVAWFPPGKSLGHVAYVEAVNGDGTIDISEMNVKGLNVISYRTIDATSVVYIY